MPGLGDFARRMSRLAEEMERGVERTKRQVALVADRELVMATPVDTGRARSNWIVSTIAPAPGAKGPYSPGSNLGLGESANAQAALAQGQAAISSSKPGQSIFITNNVSYIGRLNDNWSAQAPAGFVEAAVLRAAGVVRSSRVLRRGN